MDAEQTEQPGGAFGEVHVGLCEQGPQVRRRVSAAETGKQYGASCPSLKRRNHGQWSVRQELLYRADGTRRQFRRTGFTSATAATEELDKVRALLSLPDPDDAEALRAIGDLLEDVAGSKEPVPEREAVARRLRSRQSLTVKLTVADWLDLWISGKKRLRASTCSRYDSDIRTHLKPHLGELRLDHLQVPTSTRCSPRSTR
jgi:hypothetical protein